jgi:zinc transport system permease protein
MAYLFGDILAVNRVDLAVIWSGAALVVGMLIWRRNALLLSTLSTDLAYASGINPRREQLVLTLSLAIVVAVAIKVVGVLLITAMLIIPAATARAMSRTPLAMMLIATGVAIAAVLSGLQVSLWHDTPTGPTIVCCTAVFFILSTSFAAMFKEKPS